MDGVNINNLDPVLHDVLKKIKDDSTDHKLLSNPPKSKKKAKANCKHMCQASVKYTTINKAFLAVNDGKKDVYILRRNDNGKIKEIAVSACSRTCYSQQEYCYKHFESYTNDPSRIIYHKTDILKNKFARKATSDDSFFKKKGKRGKNSADQLKAFKDKFGKNSSILKTMSNPELLSKVEQFATALLKQLEESEDDTSSSNESDEEVSVEETKTLLKKKKVNSKEENSKEEDSEDEDSEDEETVEKTKSLLKKEKVNSEEEESKVSTSLNDGVQNSCDSEEESGDEAEVTEIKTNNGRSLWVDEETLCVYEPEDDGQGTVLGELVKIEETDGFDSFVSIDDVTYFVAVKFEHSKSEYYRCSLTNNVYDNELSHVGKLIKTKGSDSYNLKFN